MLSLTLFKFLFSWEMENNSEYLSAMHWKTEGYEQFYVSVFKNRIRQKAKKKAICGCLFDR